MTVASAACAGSAAFVWRLTPAGARLVGIRYRQSREPGLTHLSHTLEVAELVVRLHERERTTACILLEVQTEPACWRHLARHGDHVWLKPDLRLTVALSAPGVRGQKAHWFIEVDRATENYQALVRKIDAYLAAWHDGGEQTSVGVFPGVAWVVPHSQRAQQIEQILAGTSGVSRGMFTVTTRNQAITTLTNPHASRPTEGS